VKGIWGQIKAQAQQDDVKISLKSMNVGQTLESTTAHYLLGQHAGLAYLSDANIQTYQNTTILLVINGHPTLTLESGSPVFIAAEHIAVEYLAQGAAFIRALSGHFSLMLVDERNEEVFLVVDHLATRPIFYGMDNNGSFKDGLIFASHIDAINKNPDFLRGEIDPQSIFNYLYFHMVPGPETMYKSIRSIPAGHYLHYKNAATTINPYWKLQFKENEHAPFETLQKQFKDILRSSVERAATGQSTGAFLSGGTDSSTVSGFLGEVTGKPAKTYSIGFAADDYDETEFARLTSRHFKTEHHEYSVTPNDVVDAIPHIAQLYDQPFGNASAVPTYYCAKLAREDGVERILGGDGGDELFGGNTRYAKQRVFSLYNELPKALRKGLIEPAINMVPFGNSIPPVRKIRRYISQASTPMPERMESYNLLNRITPARVFTPEFLEQVDTTRPIQLLQETYNGAHAKTQLNRMLALDIKFTLTDNDLPKVTSMCELAQMEAGFPLLDDELIEFSARLAPDLKLRGNQLRYFFKKALADFLPAEVLVKKKHGFGLPFGVWMEDHPKLKKIANDSLNDLRKRNIIRTEFIDELQGELVAAHPGYYGTLIWILMMLEQWFQHHHSE